MANNILDFSNNFVISSGTIPIDPKHRLVLLLFNRKKGEYLLPKGRKDLHESLTDAALRETKEESGFNCQLLAHRLPTNATRPLGTSKNASHTEPIAVQQRLLQNGTRKIIFWFVGEVNVSDELGGLSQPPEKDFQICWTAFEDAPGKMSYPEDQELVQQALSKIFGK